MGIRIRFLINGKICALVSLGRTDNFLTVVMNNKIGIILFFLCA